jgi:hypothetical protein
MSTVRAGADLASWVQRFPLQIDLRKRLNDDTIKTVEFNYLKMN